MAIRRCSWCGKTLGVARDVAGAFTLGICELCAVRLDAEAALAHAIVGVEAIAAELRRARDGIWPPPPHRSE
jgi:hypothetical protein